MALVRNIPNQHDHLQRNNTEFAPLDLEARARSEAAGNSGEGEGKGVTMTINTVNIKLKVCSVKKYLTLILV